MQDEFFFTCEFCGEQFPADPDTMLICKADFKCEDPQTGEVIPINEDIRQYILHTAANDPEIGPFLKGAVCICVKCQDKFASESQTLAKE
jgi:hypothetical protein